MEEKQKPMDFFSAIPPEGMITENIEHTDDHTYHVVITDEMTGEVREDSRGISAGVFAHNNEKSKRVELYAFGDNLGIVKVFAQLPDFMRQSFAVNKSLREALIAGLTNETREMLDEALTDVSDLTKE